MRAEGKSGQFGDLFGSALGEFRMCIQPRADRGTADGQIVESLEHLLKPGDVAIKQAGPPAEFLPNGQGNGVLQVGTADFHYAVEFLGLGRDGLRTVLIAGSRVLYALGCGDVHRRGKCVVRRLRHVDVIIGMNRFFDPISRPRFR